MFGEKRANNLFVHSRNENNNKIQRINVSVSALLGTIDVHLEDAIQLSSTAVSNDTDLPQFLFIYLPKKNNGKAICLNKHST